MAAPVAPSGADGKLVSTHSTTLTEKITVPARTRNAFTRSHRLVMMCLKLGMRKVGSSISSGNCCTLPLLRAIHLSTQAVIAADRMPARYSANSVSPCRLNTPHTVWLGMTAAMISA